MEIPTDVISLIFAFFELKDVREKLTVSKNWYEALNSNFLWKLFYKRRWKYNTPNSTAFFKKEYKKRLEIEQKWTKDKSKTVILEGHSLGVTACCYYKETLLTGSLDQTIRQWDIKTGKTMRTLKGHNNGIQNIFVYQDKFIISQCGQNSMGLEGDSDLPNLINFYDYTEGKLLKSIACQGARTSHFTLLKDSFIYVLYVDEEFYLIYQDFEGIIKDNLKLDCMVCSSALDKNNLALGLSNGFILIYDIDTKKSKQIFADSAPILSLKYQDSILISGSAYKITIWDKDPIDISLKSKYPLLLSLDSFHHENIIVRSRMACHVFKLFEGEYKHAFVLEHSSFITHVYIDDHKIITCAKDNQVYVWDIHTGELLYDKHGFISQINCIDVQDEILFACSADLTSRVFDFRDISNKLRKPLNCKELTPKDKIKEFTNKKKDKILVLTGAFSPIHLMHVQLLNNIKKDLENKGFNILGGYLSPAHDDYNKFGLLPAYDRVEMCEIAIKESDWIMVDKWECSQSGFVMQDQVLKHLQDMFPEASVSYVCGSDLIETMSIHHLLPFGVICQVRPGYKSSIKHKNLIYCEVEIKDTSSSQIRALLGKGEKIDKIVHPGIIEYIEKNKIQFI